MMDKCPIAIRHIRIISHLYSSLKCLWAQNTFSNKVASKPPLCVDIHSVRNNLYRLSVVIGWLFHNVREHSDLGDSLPDEHMSYKFKPALDSIGLPDCEET